jgi:hypothetical protein
MIMKLYLLTLRKNRNKVVMEDMQELRNHIITPSTLQQF